MASLHKKRRIEMKQLYDKYCQYVAEPMSEEKWFKMTMMKGKIILSEAKRNYDPREVRKAKAKEQESQKEAEKKKKEEDKEKREIEKLEKETKEADEKEEKETSESEDKVAEEEKGEEKSKLKKAYEDEDYNALGKALKKKVEKVPASKDDRLEAAKEILEKGE